MTGAVTLAAPAKLTLTLRVTGVRPDGYHLIDAELVSLDIADELTFRDAGGAGTKIDLTGPAADGLPAGPDTLLAPPQRAVAREAHVRLDQRIRPRGSSAWRTSGKQCDSTSRLWRWRYHYKKNNIT